MLHRTSSIGSKRLTAEFSLFNSDAAESAGKAMLAGTHASAGTTRVISLPVAHVTAKLPSPMCPMSTIFWAEEAIRSLGYLKPETAKLIAMLIEENPTQHPRAIATSYRKEGEQIAKEEKKRLGIRANSFMSKDALDDLTEKGLANPLAAHEQTILRASLAVSRARRISSEQEQGVTQWKFSGAGSDDCAGCKRLEDEVISIDEALPTGPYDCGRDACAAFYMAQMDYLQCASPDGTASDDAPRSKRPWWKVW